MKNITMAILIFGCFLTLAGCGSEVASSPAEASEGKASAGGNTEGFLQGTTASGTETDALPGTALSGDSRGTGGTDDRLNKETVTWRLRIVDGAESGALLLAGENSGDVYSLSVGEIPVYLDGRQSVPSALRDGMPIDVTFDGMIMDTFPAMLGQIYHIQAYSQGTEQNPAGGCFDLCGLYLQVLDDLWDTDPGLNSDISFISLDLSQAPGGLTEGEKNALAWIFAGRHGLTALSLSYEELAEQGYLTDVGTDSEHRIYQWEDGILFTITPAEWEEGEHYSLPALKFNAEKWRSPRGAYFFTDCLTVWPETGTWNDYQIGGEAIS